MSARSRFVHLVERSKAPFHALAAVGLLLMLSGVWEFSHRTALIVAGLTLFLLGFFAAIGSDPYHLRDKNW